MAPTLTIIGLVKREDEWKERKMDDDASKIVATLNNEFCLQ